MRKVCPPEELEALAFAIACDEGEDIAIGLDVRDRSWKVLPLIDPGCYFLEHQRIVEAP